MAQLTVTASLDVLPRITAHILEAAERAGVPPDRRSRIVLVAEEVLVNIVTHAYGDTPGDIAVSCCVEQRGFCCTFADHGPPFNPLTLKRKPQEGDIEQRVPGGVGLTLVTAMTDQCDYRRAENRNELTFCFDLEK